MNQIIDTIFCHQVYHPYFNNLIFFHLFLKKKKMELSCNALHDRSFWIKTRIVEMNIIRLQEGMLSFKIFVSSFLVSFFPNYLTIYCRKQSRKISPCLKVILWAQRLKTVLRLAFLQEKFIEELKIVCWVSSAWTTDCLQISGPHFVLH